MCIGAFLYNWIQFQSFNANTALERHALMMMIGMCRVYEMSQSSKVLLFHSQPCSIICAYAMAAMYGRYIMSFITDVFSFDSSWKLFVYTAPVSKQN